MTTPSPTQRQRFGRSALAAASAVALFTTWLWLATARHGWTGW